MSLKQKCQKYDFKLIDKLKLDIMSMAKLIILLVEKANGRKLDDKKVADVLLRQVKERCKCMLKFKKGEKWDLIRKMRSEIGILLNYLPQQLSEKKLSEIFRKAVDKVGAESIKSEKYYGNCCT
ncbi:GatB/YqeY domain-containing protein [Clostridium sp. BJN0013]|uniref:GatB/YqeY domain-containing protein n=1 Tax=Clostridium sp. BJN0013 TaxID=3236840 RepID=UPI0034C5D6C5